MMNRPCLNMNGMFQIISTPQSPQLTAQLIIWSSDDLDMLWWTWAFTTWGICFKMKPSSYKLKMISCDPYTKENISALVQRMLLNCLTWWLLKLQNKGSMTYFWCFWLVIKQEKQWYTMQAMLGDPKPLSKRSHPQGRKARCSKILETMQWYDVMPWGS
jgi:hypothetical protein